MISEQGKPPDFVMEVASRYSANMDRGVKKDYYERLRVSEYWLFDSAGEFYGFVLKGYRLVGDRYEEIAVREVRPGVFEGYCAALDLILRVEDGSLGMYNPATGEHIPTFQSERARADTAEAQVRELQAELDRLRAGR